VKGRDDGADGAKSARGDPTAVADHPDAGRSVAPVCASLVAGVDAPFDAGEERAGDGSKPNSRRSVGERGVPEALARSVGGDTSGGCRLSADEGSERELSADCAGDERVNGHGGSTPAGDTDERAVTELSPERSVSAG